MTAQISSCETTSCTFNNNGCTAFATTMGSKGCVTFVEIGTRPVVEHTAQVGACKRTDCTFNANLECSAKAVLVGSDEANCLTFQKA